MLHSDKVEVLNDIIAQFKIKYEQASAKSKQWMFEASYWLGAIRDKEEKLAELEAEKRASEVEPLTAKTAIDVDQRDEYQMTYNLD